MEKIFFQKTKQSYRLRVTKVFVFFKKKHIFSKKKKVSKLSVFENGHFWLYPHFFVFSTLPKKFIYKYEWEFLSNNLLQTMVLIFKSKSPRSIKSTLSL
jgi:hypothetical protein